MLKVNYFNETKYKIEELPEIKNCIKIACKVEKLISAEFNIIFVDNEYIRKINKEYREKDAVTDVISFALEDYKDYEYQNYRVLGDIYISYDKAKEQAIDYGHSLLRELAFLSVHGFLHLLGYDHLNEEEEKKMFAKQEEILHVAKIER